MPVRGVVEMRECAGMTKWMMRGGSSGIFRMHLKP
jgi:hypothetical protein